jgi:hypothetical protein
MDSIAGGEEGRPDVCGSLAYLMRLLWYVHYKYLD